MKTFMVRRSAGSRTTSSSKAGNSRGKVSRISRPGLSLQRVRSPKVASLSSGPHLKEVLDSRCLRVFVFCQVELPRAIESPSVRAWMEDVHFAQVKSYLMPRLSQVGLLINFNASTLVVKRIVG